MEALPQGHHPTAVIAALLAGGANPNAREGNGHRPLHAAIAPAKNPEFVELAAMRVAQETPPLL